MFAGDATARLTRLLSGFLPAMNESWKSFLQQQIEGKLASVCPISKN
tara:strand:+ start:303 stop:443 length:141 start_codon:yes stop_codon:yes gene_type:complete